MKLVYAAVFALFPLAAPAQTLDPSMPAAVCNDDHCEDNCGQDVAISSGEILTIEAILERYSAVVTRDTDGDLAGVVLSDPEGMTVGSIHPRSENVTPEQAVLTDDDLRHDPPVEVDTIASQVTPPEPQLDKVADDADDIATTGPTAMRIIPTDAAASSADDYPINE
jgi:hypothetical protein